MVKHKMTSYITENICDPVKPGQSHNLISRKQASKFDLKRSFYYDFNL